VEIIRPGAFSEALSSKNAGEIFATYNHKNDQQLGRMNAGNLKLYEDHKGLFFECDLPETTYAKDMVAKVKHNLTRGCSFGFWEYKGKVWTDKTRGLHRREGERIVREYHAIDLFEVSVVDEPTWRQTEVAVRSFEELRALDEQQLEIARKLIDHKIKWLKSRNP
jgi:HK97 family phage prohead protease